MTPATKRAPLADRKQKRRDREEADEPDQSMPESPHKRVKKSTLSVVMDDKQKALRSVALGGFAESCSEHALKLASAAGEVLSQLYLIFFSPA